MVRFGAVPFCIMVCTQERYIRDLRRRLARRPVLPRQILEGYDVQDTSSRCGVFETKQTFSSLKALRSICTEQGKMNAKHEVNETLLN